MSLEIASTINNFLKLYFLMALIKKNILLLFIKNISINLKFTLILKQIKTLSWFPESILV